jgi:hypothetical protein
LKINFDFVPVDLMSEQSITMPDGKTPATLARLCVQALGAALPDEQDQTAEDKVRAWSLGGKIVRGGVVDLPAEDIALLKKRVGKLYGPFVVGPCLEALEQDASHLALVADAAKEAANG